MGNNIIGIGSCSFYYFYILGAFISKISELVVLDFSNEYGFKLDKCFAIKNLLTYIGYIIFGYLFYLNERIKKDDTKKTSLHKSNSLVLIYESHSMDLTQKQVVIIIFLSFIFHSFQTEVKSLLYMRGFQPFNLWTTDIFFMRIFLKKYFVMNEFNHQKLSLLFVMIACSVVLIIAAFLDNTPFKENGQWIVDDVFKVKTKNDAIKSFLIFLLFMILSSIYSHIRVINKFSMEKKFISSYKIIIFIGIFGILISIILSIICAYFGLDHIDDVTSYNIIEYFGNFTYHSAKNTNFTTYEYYEGLGFYLILMFIYFMEIFCEMKIIFYLNPVYVLISNTFCYGVMELKQYLNDDEDFRDAKKTYFIFIEISEVVAFIGYSFYLEIIELKYLGLDYNTRKNIMSRGDVEFKETMLLNFNINEEDSDDET